MGSVLKSLWNIKQQSESCHKPEERMSNDGKVEVKENQIDAYYQLESSVDGDQFHSQIELESDDTSVDNRKTMSVGEVDNMTDSCQTTLDESEIGVGNGGGQEIVPRLVCEDEGRMGGPIFDPPLYLQRYSFVSDKLKCLKAQSVVDIGCSECQICRYFADISSVQQIALVDMDRRLLEKHKYQIRPSVFHYLDKRKHPLTVRLYHGDATVLDTRMLGYDAVSMIEFIEHLYPDDLRKVSHVVFHELRPRIVIVTTPNFEFNQLFPADGRTFRHPDHKFEWIREEFQRWGDLQAGNHGYCVQYTGVGDPPPKNRHLGYCSQAAIFEKVNANKVPQPSENCNQTYTLKIGIYNMKSVMEVRGVAIVLVVLSITSAVHGAFNPILTVDSCTKSKLVLNVTEASSSGIIYIQGQTSVCKQDTYNGSHIHEFDFASCGISWANSFKVIVQKKSLYQTGDDKQIPIMCVADLSDLTVANGINALDKDDDAGQNLTVKPTALMKLFKNGVDVSGGNVQLTDILTMSIELDSEFLDDFDIVAISCYASTINIIDDDCAVDSELFPNFQKPITGIISAAFGAFRTTDLMGGSVGMTFSCTLKVCLGSCAPTFCASGETGYGRKKRSAYETGIQKRQAEGATSEAYEEISVGSTLRIATEQVIIEDGEEASDVCMDRSVFIAGMAVTVTVLTTLSGSIGYLVVNKMRSKVVEP